MRPASGPLRKYPVTPTAQHAVMDTKIPGNLRDLLAALLDQPHGLQLELTSELLSLRRHETPPGGKLPRAWSGVHETQGGPIAATLSTSDTVYILDPEGVAREKIPMPSQAASRLGLPAGAPQNLEPSL